MDRNNNSRDRDPVTERFSSPKWLKAEADPKDYMYEPLHFIRSHCKADTISDCKTQIWDVVFEPGQKDVVATCGGRYLCVFSVSTGDLLMKYTHKEMDHELYSLSWTVLDCGNLLASGSASGEVRLYHPAREVSFHHWTKKKGVAVNAVKFHSSQPSWLFTATNDSVVSLWDIGDPSPPHYSKCKEVQLLKLAADMGDVYSMAWVGEEQWVMVGTQQGLVGWKIREDKIKEVQFPKHKPGMVEFNLPGVSTSNPYVDSVCSLGGSLVAVKCVGYGKICVFRAQFKDLTNQTKYYKVEVLAEFGWLKTDNFYMNIGGSSQLGLMGCGDDQGSTWVYKLPAWLAEEDSPESLPQKILPIGRLHWPDLGSKPKNSEDTMLDKIAFSPCGQYLLAVTNTNIVAIWKKEN
eukprot:GFUD01025969.1.p1 GENE.GFUD01025969.1~~GFUD01025969.1.p1  ORF type:complete len:405 (+),score=122.90 GFUD01025969.1:71-1285(+)